jgi:serine/threonine protein kinase
VIEAPWEKVRDLLDSALELPREERSRYLDEHCSDPPVRRSVDALIESYEESTTFLETPTISSFSEPEQSWAGRSLGPYRLLDEIGAGGMGVVYRATRADDEYSQNVAVKIVNGIFISKQLVDRFRAERQILANLNHPNIARLLDGGTTPERLPYLVMEFVEGTPIDEYCDVHHRAVHERLDLFVRLCGAVQYAHQNLIVHRDLKPGNILVTADGTPKLLDFGIAKILDPVGQRPTGEQTKTLQPMMTPEYASPEQFEGRPVTTASDVYSLGVVLYHLLTGRRRYVKAVASARDLAHAVTAQTPIRPSIAIGRAENVDSEDDQTAIAAVVNNRRARSIERLRKELAGDLDAIVLKSLERDASRRYSSVEQFTDDLRRFLSGQPVHARLPTLRYRAAKFVRRNAAAVSATLLVVIASVIAVGWIARAEHTASRERARADQRFNDVRSLANSLMFDIHDSIKDLPGSTPARKLVVERALTYLDSLSREANGDSSLQRELAAAYERVGDVQGNPYYANLGDTSGALASYRKAVAIREGLLKSDSVKTSDRWSLCKNYIAIAASSEANRKFPEALANARKASAISDALLPQAQDPATRELGAGPYYYLGNILAETGDLGDALESYRKAVAVLKSVQPATSAQNTAIQTHLAGNYSGIARVLAWQKQFGSAVEAQKQATLLLEALSLSNPANATLRGFLGDSYQFLGSDLNDNGDLDHGLQYLRRAENIYQALRSADPSNALIAYRLAYTEINIGEIMLTQRRSSGAVQILKTALTRFQALMEGHPENGLNYQGLADAYAELGKAYEQFASNPGSPSQAKLRDWTEARTSYQKSQAVLVQAHDKGVLETDKSGYFARLSQDIATCDVRIARLSR